MNACFRCAKPTICTERDEYEELGPSRTLVKHISFFECQECQASMTLISPVIIEAVGNQPHGH